LFDKNNNGLIIKIVSWFELTYNYIFTFKSFVETYKQILSTNVMLFIWLVFFRII
jgi:hypothetical protein